MTGASRFCAAACAVAAVSALAICAISAGCSGSGPDGGATAVLGEAWDLFDASEYSAALDGFLDAERLAGEDAALRQQALFGQGLVWHVRTRPHNDPAKARAAYGAAIDLDPASDIAAWADLWRARIASEVVDGEYPPAADRLAAYREAAGRHPDHPAGEEALLCALAIQAEDEDPVNIRATRDALRDFLAGHPASGWRQTAYGILAHCDEILGDGPAHYDDIRLGWDARYINPKAPDADLGGEDWNLAQVAEFETGDFDAARQHYRDFIEHYPTDMRIYLAELEIGRMDNLERETAREASAGPEAAPAEPAAKKEDNQ